MDTTDNEWYIEIAYQDASRVRLEDLFDDLDEAIGVGMTIAQKFAACSKPFEQNPPVAVIVLRGEVFAFEIAISEFKPMKHSTTPSLG